MLKTVLNCEQLIKAPERVICHTSTLTDHILASSSEKVVQAGIIETSLSDHELIFCIRKIGREQPNKRSYLTFCSMKIFKLAFTRKPGAS